MPYYLPENITREGREKKRRENVCKICGEFLSLYYDPDRKLPFLACHRWLDTHHEGIEKQASKIKMKGMAAMTIPDVEEILEKEFGKSTAVALRQYQGLTTLNKDQAKEILTTIWPDAKGPELFKAMQICATYGLNPLMRHVYLIPFKEGGKDGDGKTKLICVMGIGANRLIASRKHQYSYIDDTPRMMSNDEEMRHYGDIDNTKLRGITKLKDVKSGAEAAGYGEWPRNKDPYGSDKGNSKANMVFIRSERQALDRLYPADMPSADIPIIDEDYIEGEASYVEDKQKLNGEKRVESPPEALQNAQDAQPAIPARKTTAEEEWEKLNREKVLTPKQKLMQAMKDNGYNSTQVQDHMKQKYGKNTSEEFTVKELTELTSDVINCQVKK